MASRSPLASSLPHGKGIPGLPLLLLGGFVTIFDLFVVNVAIPNMQRDLGASFAQIGFVLAGYELAFGALLITGGRLGDRFGRRRLYLWGMALFTLASLLCGIAPTAEALIAARVFQGGAAALLFPQIYASLRVLYDADTQRRAFAWLGMTLGFAAIAGQVLGGWLVHLDLAGLGWRTIFLVNLPVGLVTLMFGGRLAESRLEQKPDLDGPGVLLVAAGLTLLLVALLEGPARHWPLWCWGALVLSGLLLAQFSLQQHRRQRRGLLPLVDMTLLRQPAFALGCVLVTLIYSTSSSFFLCFALLVQTGLGLDPFQAGALFAPASAGFMASSLLASRWVARYGTATLVAGGGLYAVSLGVLIAQVNWTASGGQLAGWIPVLIAVGFGQGLVMTPLLNLILGVVPRRQAGMASGVISTLQQVGAALGVCAMGMLFLGTLQAAPAADPATAHVGAFVVAMLYNLTAAVVSCVLLQRLRRLGHNA
ncbi:MFS transporter [Alloalcanivorax xenomutans]|uniref:MFS transporter n=1 Tax=Alloalcanivorax xenomutans TaxID=1094342 RepID=UPI001F15A2E5|nr:MFS transporter [Alloalcanivorax xenomutans]MCE7522411.1 MFS transporter [Alloalcanivorax xenomutans]